jgi:hypothetical protein
MKTAHLDKASRTILAAALVVATLLVADAARAGTLTVNTTTGGIHQTDGKCGFEEAIQAFEARVSQNGCNWSGTVGSNDTIVITTSASTYNVTTELHLDRPVTIKSSQANTLVNIKQTVAGTTLFSIVSPQNYIYTFQDLHLIGPGKTTTPAEATGIAGTAAGVVGGAINVTQCFIENFTESAIWVTDMTLTVKDSTLDNNSNTIEGGGGIFYEDENPSTNRTDFLIVEESSITHNFSNAGAGGIHLQSKSLLKILNSTISDNVTSGGNGGGISLGNNSGDIKGASLEIIGSTIAFNGTTSNPGGGISQKDNDPILTNDVVLSGSIVANNCFATVSSNESFTCKTGASATTDYSGAIGLLSDAMLGNTTGVSNLTWVLQNDDGVVLVNVASGLDSALSDQGGVGGHHPQVHKLLFSNGGVKSLAIDATNGFNFDDFDSEGRFSEGLDQTHHARGFDHLPNSPGVPADLVVDLGAVEHRTNP